MKSRAITMIMAVVMAATLAMAQAPNPNPAANVATNQGQFSLVARAVSLGTSTGSIPATDLGGTFAVSKSISLRQDNLVAGNSTSIMVGFQNFLPSTKLLAKTNFDPSTFQFYTTASAGEVFTAGLKHPGWLAGGGVNYDPTHTSKFTVNLIEVRCGRLPYVHQGITCPVSGGLTLGW